MIVLLLGVATVAAFVRMGDDDGGHGLAQNGPATSVATTSTTTAPATTAPATSVATTSTTTAPATTAPAAPGTGGSGLGTGDAGEVAMGPTIPNTGIESMLAPGAGLLGAGVALRALLAGRRRDTDADQR